MRRVEVQEGDDGTFIVQWYLNSRRLGILFLIQPVCAEIVNRLILVSDDRLWMDIKPEVIKAEVDTIVARMELAAAQQRTLKR